MSQDINSMGQGSQPGPKSKLNSLVTSPKPVINSMNQGGTEFASTTSLVPTPPDRLNSMNQLAQPPRKTGTGA